MKRKILYFSPTNVLHSHAGNLTRIRSMLTYFERNNKHFDVDFVIANSIEENDKQSEFKRFKDIFPHINLLKIFRRASKKNFLNYLLAYKIPRLLTKKNKLDHTTYYLKKQFKALVDKNKYDTIIISYANWGNLVQKGMNAHLIIDTHDLITAQMKTHKDVEKGWGNFLEQECAILNKFDEIWTYSIEEKYLFEQFTEVKNINLIPVTFEKQEIEEINTIQYPVLYVASDNQHNINSMEWYLANVAPLLGDVVTYVVGVIGERIGEYKNVVKLGVVEDLQTIYKHSRVCICPMLTGTGVKIKVLEALSYGVPVVTTPRGLDGLINKTNNGCMLATSPEKFAEHIKSLISDDILYQEQREKGLSFVRENYSREAEIKILNASLFLNFGEGKV